MLNVVTLYAELEIMSKQEFLQIERQRSSDFIN